VTKKFAQRYLLKLKYKKQTFCNTNDGENPHPCPSPTGRGVGERARKINCMSPLNLLALGAEEG